MDNQHPPLLLIETWLELSRCYKFPEIQAFSIKKLNNVFGSLAAAECYLEENRLNAVS